MPTTCVADDHVDLGLAGEQTEHLADVVTLEFTGAGTAGVDATGGRGALASTAGGGAPRAPAAPGWPLRVGGGAMGAGAFGSSGAGVAASPVGAAVTGHGGGRGLRLDDLDRGKRCAPWAAGAGTCAIDGGRARQQQQGTEGRKVTGMIHGNDGYGDSGRTMTDSRFPKAGSEPMPRAILLC